MAMDPLYRPMTVIALVTTLVLWGSAFPALRILLPIFPPCELAAIRYCSAALILLVVAGIVRPPRPRLRDIPRLSLVALCGICLYNIAVNIGTGIIPAGPSSFIVNTAPLFSAVFAVLWLGETARPWVWAGMLICLAGVGAIAWGDGRALTSSQWGGAAVLVGAAALWAAYSVVQKPLLQTYGALGVVCYAMVLGSIMLLPFLPHAVSCLPHAPLRAQLILTYLIVGPSALAFTTWSYVVAQAPVTRVMPFLYTVPLVALALAWIGLDERPGLPALVGCVLIILGLIAVNRTIARARESAPAPAPAESKHGPKAPR